MFYIHEYSIASKPFEDNISKFCFIECLSSLDVYFSSSYAEADQLFYVKEILGSFGINYFNRFYDYLISNNSITKEMEIFLNYLVKPELQIKNYKNFKYLYKIFLDDYSLLFESEWHPKGFYNELNAYKKSTCLFEVSPLMVSGIKEKFDKAVCNLKIFSIFKQKNGNYLLVYTEYGKKLLNYLINSFGVDNEFKSQFSVFFDKEKDSYVYKLRNLVRHINKILWFFDEYKIKVFTNNFFYNEIGEISIKDLIFIEQQISILGLICEELAAEKKIVQELNYILYYPKAINGDLYFLKKLTESKSFLHKYKEIHSCAFVEAPVQDLREGRTFKRYIQFLVKAGVINSEIDTLHYLNHLKFFCTLIIHGKNLTHNHCLKIDDILITIDFLEIFIKKIKPINDSLAFEFLSKDTILEISNKKNYQI